MSMANDDDYDFSGVSQRGLSDIESSLLSQWRAQNDDEEDDDDSYFWPEQLPYDIEEKLREINKVHQEDETPIESDRPRKVIFSSRVQMRAISMRRIPLPAETSNEDEPFDLSKYDTDESVDDVETSITAPRESANLAADVARSSALPLPVPSSYRSPAGQQRPRFVNKTAVSRIGQAAQKSADGLSTSGLRGGSRGAAGPARPGFRDSLNFQLTNGLASGGLSVLSLTDEEEQGDEDDCAVDPQSSDTGYSSGTAPPQSPASSASQSISTNSPASSSVPVSTQTPEPAAELASQPSSSPLTRTASKAVPVSTSAAKQTPVTTPTPEAEVTMTAATKSVSVEVSSSKAGATLASMSSSVLSSVSMLQPAPVSSPAILALASKSASEPDLVSMTRSEQRSESIPLSTSGSATEQTPNLQPGPSASQSAGLPPDRPSAPSAPPHRAEAESGSSLTVDRLRRSIGKVWPEKAPPSEGYRPSWTETPQQASNNVSTSTAGAVKGQVANQQSDSGVEFNGVKEVKGCLCAVHTKSCVCQGESSARCGCSGDLAVSNSGDGCIRQELLGGTKSEDSAVESMDDRPSSNTAALSAEESVESALEPSRTAPPQSYAAIHLSRPSRTPRPPAQSGLPVTRSAAGGAGRPRLSRSASAGRQSDGVQPVTHSVPARPRTASETDRRTCSAGKSPDHAAVRPRSAPGRSALSTSAPPRHQLPAQRGGQQAGAGSAGASPPPRRRRARPQHPAITFQQWLQQHERQRAQASRDSKNNAQKRKQEASIKQEKAPQAFRVWLRKKRQQQLMEQRVQQLRQLELLAAAPAGRPQQDAFRQWLAVKERERTAAGRGPPQATLRSLSALYRVGRPPPAAGDRRTPHDRLQHIYRPHVSRGRRCRSACLPGS